MTIKLIFDVEANGLLVSVNQIWMIHATDIASGVTREFCDFDSTSEAFQAGLDYLHTADVLIGHFIIGYDLPALKKVCNWVPLPHQKIQDTLLMSQTLNYNRFGAGKKAVHKLEKWGEFFGIPKPEHEDWLNWSPEMTIRCREDVKINVKAYHLLLDEFTKLRAKKPLIARSLRNEHDTLAFCTEATIRGWQFDKFEAERLVEVIHADMLVMQKKIEPLLKKRVKRLDPEPKSPKWTKEGFYHAHIAKYFDIDVEEGLADFPLVMGPYSRVAFEDTDMGNIESVKELLYSIGWVPDDWNWKRVNGAFIKGTPKLSESSLEGLGEIGDMVNTYYTLRSRESIVKGWVDNAKLDERGNWRVHGDCFTIATPTGRARHNGLVNVPSVGTLYGEEIRKLFITREGWKVVGADSSGNQMRAFCFYLKNEAYTTEVISGDVHTVNMTVLQEVHKPTTRKLAKPFLYAFLFGGGPEKLSLIVIGKRDKKIGKKLKDTFTEKIPGLKALIDKVTGIYNLTLERDGTAWIPGLDGRRVFVDSPHKALNYLLQSFEAITCKAAVAMFMEETAKRGYVMGEHWVPLIFYHDEFEFECPEEISEELRVLAKECFRDAPKQFGANFMDGEAKLGDSWYAVH